MQNNDLEKYIKNNRDTFDDAYPSLKLWAAIESELEEEETTPPVRHRQMQARRPWYQVAATVAILLSLGGIGGAYLSQQNQGYTAQQVLEEVAPEFSEIEQYYTQRIQERYVQLTSHTQDSEIDADLAQIDQSMNELRAELSNAPPGREDQIVQQLMESYRLKLLILERILERMEELDGNATPTNNNSNETSI